MLDLSDYSILLLAILSLEERLEKALNKMIEDYNEGFRGISEADLEDMESDLYNARNAEKKLSKMMAEFIEVRNDTVRNGSKASY